MCCLFTSSRSSYISSGNDLYNSIYGLGFEYIPVSKKWSSAFLSISKFLLFRYGRYHAIMNREDVAEQHTLKKVKDFQLHNTLEAITNLKDKKTLSS